MLVHRSKRDGERAGRRQDGSILGQWGGGGRQMGSRSYGSNPAIMPIPNAIPWVAGSSLLSWVCEATGASIPGKNPKVHRQLLLDSHQRIDCFLWWLQTPILWRLLVFTREETVYSFKHILYN